MKSNSTSKSKPEPVEKTLSKGQHSRTTILLTAARLATVRGLEGLSIGDLATEVGMSKSGLYAHFKSKEELELATIDTASEIFDQEVIQPALTQPVGLQRLWGLVNAFLQHLQRRVFPGGCFFAAVAMELDTRPGPARDRVVAVQEKWINLLMQSLLDAQSLGEIESMPLAAKNEAFACSTPAIKCLTSDRAANKCDISQAVFEISAMLLAANFRFVLTNDDASLTLAKRGTENVLTRLTLQSSQQKRPAR